MGGVGGEALFKGLLGFHEAVLLEENDTQIVVRRGQSRLGGRQEVLLRFFQEVVVKKQFGKRVVYIRALGAAIDETKQNGARFGPPVETQYLMDIQLKAFGIVRVLFEHGARFFYGLFQAPRAFDCDAQITMRVGPRRIEL